MAEKNITVSSENEPAVKEEFRAPEKYIRPAVDIFEKEGNLILMADMPGVDKDRLDINLDRGVLTIQGRTSVESRGEPLFREFSLADYYRQFELPDDIDAEKTEAGFKNGVLTLTMAQSEAAKPRRIEINK